MRRKKRAPAKPPAAPTFKNQPFQELKKLAAQEPAAPKDPPPPKAPKMPPPPPATDEEAFLRAVADARPLDAQARERVDPPRPTNDPKPITDEEAEAIAELSDLIGGQVPFDISDSDEYVEGAMVGVDRRLVRRLREGSFAYQAHLDLHGMTRVEAREAVDEFIGRSYREGRRCVLIIHGRGLNSKDHVPVLKAYLTSWLARGQLGQRVLAFATARPCDGGGGALYVLLRKRPVKGPFDVTTGAKR